MNFYSGEYSGKETGNSKRIMSSANFPAILVSRKSEGQQLTFKELFEKINDTTKALHAIGVKPGDVVTIILPACPEETFWHHLVIIIL